MNIVNKLKVAYRKIEKSILGDDGKLSCPACMSKKIFTTESFKRTGGQKVHGKLMSYGYQFYRHACEECLHVWEIKK